MIAENRMHEYVQIYSSARKSAIETTLHWFNLSKLSIGDVQQLPWDALEKQISCWICAAKECVRVVFPAELRLCRQLFQGPNDDSDDGGGSASVDYFSDLSVVGDMCFAETVKVPATQLFSFAEAISISMRSPEKLFKILDLHEAFSNLLPDIEKVFRPKSCDSIRLQATEIKARLAEAARGILSHFENAVLHEPSKVPVPGGTIHPLTRYVMNYISLITEYKQTLSKLIRSKPSKGSARSSRSEMELTEVERQASFLALHLIWTISALTNNLEDKSKHYNDPSLAHLFMLNNLHYIVGKIKRLPDLRQMIVDNFLRKMTVDYRASATGYQRATWAGVLRCLRDEGLPNSKTAVKERFRAFNSMVDEVRRTQATWLVPDSQLREELRILVSDSLISAYRSFLGRFGHFVEGGKNGAKCYSVEDLGDALLDLFEGCPLSLKL